MSGTQELALVSPNKSLQRPGTHKVLARGRAPSLSGPLNSAVRRHWKCCATFFQSKPYAHCSEGRNTYRAKIWLNAAHVWPGTLPGICMRTEIRNIHRSVKGGAYGDPNTTGSWVYGKRPDRKGVPCNVQTLANGNVVVTSTWKSPSCAEGEVVECASEFTSEEWNLIMSASEMMQTIVCNRILKERKGRASGV
jgi:hypothetical protein